jgi:hypothetical protein
MKKQIFAEGFNDECNPNGSEFHVGFRSDLLDADLCRNFHRNRDLRALASQPEGLRRGVENAVAGGMKES